MGYFQLLEVYREFLETSETLPPETVDKMVQNLKEDIIGWKVRTQNDYVWLFYDQATIENRVEDAYDRGWMTEAENEEYYEWLGEVSDDLARYGDRYYYEKACDAWADYAYDQM